MLNLSTIEFALIIIVTAITSFAGGCWLQNYNRDSSIRRYTEREDERNRKLPRYPSQEVEEYGLDEHARFDRLDKPVPYDDEVYELPNYEYEDYQKEMEDLREADWWKTGKRPSWENN